MSAAEPRIGPYEVQRRLGVGGMAETLIAVRRGPGGFEQRVCLKRVLPAYAEDESFREAFLDEARLVARLRHTNIVQVYDFGRAGDSWYLALELIDGLDMQELLEALAARGERLPLDVLMLVAMELGHALDYAHRLAIGGAPAHVVHRDLSPSNVLLSTSGEVKLADFGIAKASTRTHHTATGIVKGKAPYMSPEQAQAQPVDGRTDLFALGVILYESLAGRRPFDGATDSGHLDEHPRG